MAVPNSFDHYRRVEPYGGIQGAVDNRGLDYYRRGEPLPFFQGALGRVYKRFYGPALLPSSAVTLFACHAGRRAFIKRMHVSNPSAGAVDLTLSIGSDAAGTRVNDDYAIGADSAQGYSTYYVLEAGEAMQALAGSAATINLTLSGWEDPA
jgi:hypothetical protein